MTNSEIVEKLETAVALMDLLDHNPFKIKAYQSAAIKVDKIPTPIRLLPVQEIEETFTKAMAKNILELLATETFQELADLESQVPVGVRSMLSISGIGPKKVKILWKEMGLENLTALRDSCSRGLVAQVKGFGEKTQATILEGLDFLESISGKLLMHHAEQLSTLFETDLKQAGVEGVIRVGDLATMGEVVTSFGFLVPLQEREKISSWIEKRSDFQLISEKSGPFRLETFYLPKGVVTCFYFSGKEDWARNQFMLCTPDAHWQSAYVSGIKLYAHWKSGDYSSEAELYEKAGSAEIPVDVRTGLWEFGERSQQIRENLIQYSDLKGCIHNHSTYSDGKNTLLEMAQWCIARGWEYFGIADHSPTAIYANGLIEDRVLEQWREIEALNTQLAPFKILKGIESDILPNGNLDFPNDVLAGFDYVVASVHSGLKMDVETATARLIKAIENPFTTILGHCSGRILLKRSGYPLHYEKIIDACIANGVVIEINAHPSRLDMDWRNLHKALEQGALISINPDAHEKEGMDLMQYGTWMARKAGASKEQVLNARSLKDMEAFLNARKSKQ